MVFGSVFSLSSWSLYQEFKSKLYMTYSENKLKGKKIAILATDGFEEVELTEPKKILESEGAGCHIVSDNAKITSWHERQWNEEFEADIRIEQASAEDYDALILPGGVISPDRLRRNKKAVDLVRDFNSLGKLIAAICHGPQMLIEADIVKDKALTSFHSIKTDLKNAGANWADADAVVDKNLVTSRHPDDLRSFCLRIIEGLSADG
jgi:protease I